MINRVVLVGRLTNDIEIRKTSSGLSVASFTIACNRRVAQGQERQADFINCVAWRQTADFLSRFARKGSLVGVEGRIQTRHYEGQDGKRVYVTEIVCDSAQLLESKQTTESRPASNQSQPSYGAPAYQQADDMYDLGEAPMLDISSDDLPF